MNDQSRSHSPGEGVTDEATKEETVIKATSPGRKRTSLIKQQTINKIQDEDVAKPGNESHAENPLPSNQEVPEDEPEHHSDIEVNNNEDMGNTHDQEENLKSSHRKSSASNRRKSEGTKDCTSRKNRKSRPSMIAIPTQGNKDTLYVDGLTSRAVSSAVVTPMEGKPAAKSVFLNTKSLYPITKAKGRRCVQSIKISLWVCSVFTIVFAFFYFFLHVLLLVKVWDPAHSALDVDSSPSIVRRIIDPGINAGTSLPPLESLPETKHEDHRHSKAKSVLSLILILVLSFHSTLFYLFSSKLAKSVRTIDNFHRFASTNERSSVGNIFKIYANDDDLEPFSPVSPTPPLIPVKHRSSSGCNTGCSPISCRVNASHRGHHHEPRYHDNYFNYDHPSSHHHHDHHYHHHHRHHDHSDHSSKGRNHMHHRHPQFHVKTSRARSRIDKEMGITSRDRKYLMLSFFGLLIAILCLLIHSMIQLIFCLAVYSPFMDLMDCLLLILSSFIIIFSLSFIFAASYYHRQTLYN